MSADRVETLLALLSKTPNIVSLHLRSAIKAWPDCAPQQPRLSRLHTITVNTLLSEDRAVMAAALRTLRCIAPSVQNVRFRLYGKRPGDIAPLCDVVCAALRRGCHVSVVPSSRWDNTAVDGLPRVWRTLLAEGTD